MKMKKILASLLALLLSASFAGCSGDSSGDSSGGSPNETAEIATSDTDSNTEAAAVTENDKYAEPLPIRDISSIELIKEIKTGWNLGNTLDASPNYTPGYPLPDAETAWGNPTTTAEMMKAVAERGFDAVRVPITWNLHMGEGTDYIINEKWLARVKEVVGYVLDAGMYCIINTHHEEWIFPSYEKEEESKAQLVALWKQVAECFKNYDEKLIFEGLNEPRMRGTEYEWNGGNEEGWAVVNSLNAAFVETVRASGGNNALRHLMIPSYAASADPRAYKALTLPENDDKIIVSIHAYIPNGMALAAGGQGKWLSRSEGSTSPIDNLTSGLKELFIDKNIAVILGEMGARDKDNLKYRVLWADYFFGRAAEAGIPCFWWDNGAFSGTGEIFGLFNRLKLTWQFPEIVDAVMNAAKAGKPLLTHIQEVEELTFD